MFINTLCSLTRLHSSLLLAALGTATLFGCGTADVTAEAGMAIPAEAATWRSPSLTRHLPTRGDDQAAAKIMCVEGIPCVKIGVGEENIMPELTESVEQYLSGIATQDDGISTVSVSRLSLEGQLLDENPLVVSTARTGEGALLTGPVMAGDGENTLVVFREVQSGQAGIFARRVSARGELLDRENIVLSPTAGEVAPAVGFGHGLFMASFLGADQTLMATRLRGDGSVLDPRGIPLARLSGVAEAPAMAFDGERFLVVFQAVERERLSLGGIFVDLEGVASEPFVIASGMRMSMHPSVAFAGGQYLVTFADDRNGTADIYGILLGRDGRVLRDLELATGALDQVAPDVTAVGGGFFVAFNSARDEKDGAIEGVLLDREGSLMKQWVLAQGAILDSPLATCYSGKTLLTTYWGEDDGMSILYGSLL